MQVQCGGGKQRSCKNWADGLKGNLFAFSLSAQGLLLRSNTPPQHKRRQLCRAATSSASPFIRTKKATAKCSRSCDIIADYRTRSSGTRTAAAAESRPKGGCCNRRLSCLMGDVAKIYFQTQSHSKHEYLRSKQQPTIDKSAEAQHAERVPLSAQKDE